MKKKYFLMIGAVLVTAAALALGGCTEKAPSTAEAEISGAGESNRNGAYTVTFNSQGGSAVASQSVTNGGTVPYPEEPTKAGVYFDGWYNESGCTNTCDYAAPVSGPLTLYAKWLTESDMIAGEFGEGVPETFEVDNASAASRRQPGWDSSWGKARDAINSGGNDKNYIIKVTGNLQLATSSSGTFTPRNIKILIYTPTDKAISGSGLSAGANQTLILRHITVGSATSSTNAHLLMRPGAKSNVNVRGGTFTMSGGTGDRVSVDSGIFTMNGGAISGVTVNRGGTFTMDGGTSGSVSVKGGTFTMSGGTGGDVSVETIGTFTMNGGAGGRVSVTGGTFTMSDGAICGNTVKSMGGGVSVSSGTFTMIGGAISGNSTTNYGGGVYVGGGSFTMTGGAISGNNVSDGYGGGVYIGGGSFTMTGGAISGNDVSDGYGGGVSVSSGTFTMIGGVISGNSTANYGGGVQVDKGGAFTMGGGAISDNSGGGVSVVGGAFMMSDGAISGNSYIVGGGVRVYGGAFTMSGGAISGNTASSGGGVDVDGRGTFTMSGGAISGNRAISYGGGVYAGGGTFTMNGGTVYGKKGGKGLANTAKSGASLSIRGNASIAKYDNGGDIIGSGIATDTTLNLGQNAETPQAVRTHVTIDTAKLLPVGGGKYETLLLRGSPSRSATAVSRLSRGTSVEILEEGETTTVDDGAGGTLSGRWVKIRGDGSVGWCFSGYLEAY